MLLHLRNRGEGAKERERKKNLLFLRRSANNAEKIPRRNRFITERENTYTHFSFPQSLTAPRNRDLFFAVAVCGKLQVAAEGNLVFFPALLGGLTPGETPSPYTCYGLTNSSFSVRTTCLLRKARVGMRED